MKNIYQDGTYIHNNPGWHAEDSAWKSKQIINIIKKNKIEFSNICEIGCGAGEIVKILSEQLGNEIKYFGYEISNDAFEICKKKENDYLKFYLKDLLEEDERFDTLLCIDVFEHVQDYIGFLTKLKNKANYKIFHIPIDLSVHSILRAEKIIDQRYSVGHLHYFTKETAIAVLEDLGYEIIDCFYTAGSIELPRKTIKSRILKIPRKIMFKLSKDFAVKLFGGFSILVLTK